MSFNGCAQNGASVTDVLLRKSHLVHLDSSTDPSCSILDPCIFLLAISLRTGSVDATSIDELISTTLGSGHTGIIRWVQPERFLHPHFEYDKRLDMHKRAMHDQIQTTIAQAAGRLDTDGMTHELRHDISGHGTNIDRKRRFPVDAIAPKVSKVPKLVSIEVKSADSPRSLQTSTGTCPSIGGSVHSSTSTGESPQSAMKIGPHEPLEEESADPFEQLTEEDWATLDLDFSMLEPKKALQTPAHTISIVESMALPTLEFLQYLAKINVTNVQMTGKKMRNKQIMALNGGSRNSLTSFVYRCRVTPGCGWQSTTESFQAQHDLTCSETPWMAPVTWSEYQCGLCQYVPASTAEDPEKNLYIHVRRIHLWQPKKCTVEGCISDSLFTTEPTYTKHMTRFHPTKKNENENEDENEKEE